MTDVPSWWARPRTVSVVVDNESWILPHAQDLVVQISDRGDNAKLCRSYDEVEEGGIAFLIGCIKLAPTHILQRNHRNLVVHESDLPKGRGFAPITWQVLEGKTQIPVCLLEAVDGPADSGPIVLRNILNLEGHELCDEIRQKQGLLTISLCMRFLSEEHPREGTPQSGPTTSYKRRTPKDSRLDPKKSLAEQFSLLRVVDNERYPAFFEWKGVKYFLQIKKAHEESGAE